MTIPLENVPLSIRSLVKNKNRLPLNWDCQAADRAITDERMAEIWGHLAKMPDGYLSQEFFDLLVSIKAEWQSRSAVPASEAERKAKNVSKKAEQLAKMIDEDQEAIRSHHSTPLNVNFLFPDARKHLEDSPASEFYGALDMQRILRAYSKLVATQSKWEDEKSLPRKSRSKNAERTFIIQSIHKYFSEKLGISNARWVTICTVVVLGIHESELEENHVSKLMKS